MALKIVFIAGPYFGKGNKEEIEKNIREAEKYQAVLANARVGFFCAHNHTEHFQEKAKAPETFYHELDVEFLKRSADAVLAMPDWKKSPGAKREVEWAISNNLPVFYPESTDDLDEIIKWAK